MKITFNINYRTNWGEEVGIYGSIPALGNGNEANALKMNLDGTENWQAVIEVPDTTPDFTYSYIIKHENGTVRKEWGIAHAFRRGRSAKTYEIFDQWQDQPIDRQYYSSAFTDCICHRENREKAQTVKNGIINIRVSAPMIKSDEILAISGGCEQLGNWNTDNAIIMNDANYPEWNVNLEMKTLKTPVEYKFVILKKDTHEVVAWEAGNNRYFNYTPAQKHEVMVVAGLRFNNPLAPWRGAGVAIPVFSVRSENDFGVGDFYDLKLVIDWAESTGQKFLQILTLDSSSSFSLVF